MSEEIVLGYWAVRGRAHFLRHLLAYTGLPFSEKQYKTQEEYTKDKSSIIPFPNLPYLRDGEFTISESFGIARYIARRAERDDLLGANPADQAKMDNFMYAWKDLITPLVEMFFNKKILDVKAGHYYKIKSNLERFEKFSQGKETLLGYLTIADFYVAQMTYYIQKLYPEEFPKYRNLLTIRQNIESLPEVQGYYQRQTAIVTPFLPSEKTAIPFFFPGTQPSSLGPKPVSKKITTIKPRPTEELKQNLAQSEAQENFDQEVQLYNSGNVYKVAVISGSVSGNSPSNFFLGALTNIGHPMFEFDWCDISTLQLHNQDIDEGTDNANSLRGQVYEATAVLIGIVETNGLPTAVLTNAFNWLAPVLKEKPVALVSIQSSQQTFRKALDREGVPYLRSAKLNVHDASTFFNEQGGISGNNLNKSINFFNKLAIYLETGN